MLYNRKIFGSSPRFQTNRLLAFGRVGDALPPPGGNFELSGKSDLTKALAALKDRGGQKEIEFLLRAFLASNGNMADIGGPGQSVTRLSNLNEKIVAALEKNGLFTSEMRNALPVSINEVVDLLITEVQYITPDDLDMIKKGLTNRITNPSPRDLRRMAILEQKIQRGGDGAGYAAIELDDFRNGRRGSVPIPGSARKRYASGRGWYWEVFDGSALGGDQLVSIDPAAGLGAAAPDGAWKRSSDFQPVDFAGLRARSEAAAAENGVVYNPGWNESNSRGYAEWMWNPNWKPSQGDLIMKGWKRDPVDDERRRSNRNAAATLGDLGASYDPITGGVKFGDLEYARQEAEEASTRASRLNKAANNTPYNKTMLDMQGSQVLRQKQVPALRRFVDEFTPAVARIENGTVRFGNGPGKEKAEISVVPRFVQILPNGTLDTLDTGSSKTVSRTVLTNAIEKNGQDYFDVKEVDFIVRDLTTNTEQRFATQEEASAFARTILDSNRVSDDELASELQANQDAAEFEYNSQQLTAGHAAKFARSGNIPELNLRKVTIMDNKAFRALGSALSFSQVQVLKLDGGTLFQHPDNLAALSTFLQRGGQIYLENDSCPRTMNTKTARDILNAIGTKWQDQIHNTPLRFEEAIVREGKILKKYAQEPGVVATIGSGDQLSQYIPSAWRPSWKELLSKRPTEDVKALRFLNAENDPHEAYLFVKINGADGFAHVVKDGILDAPTCLFTLDEAKQWIKDKRASIDIEDLPVNQKEIFSTVPEGAITAEWLFKSNAGGNKNFETLLEIKDL